MALIKKKQLLDNTGDKSYGTEFSIHLHIYEIIRKICMPMFCSTVIQFFSEECLRSFLFERIFNEKKSFTSSHF